MIEKIDTPKSRIAGWLKKIIPVVVSGLVLYYYFHGQDWAKIGDAIRKANLILAFSAVLIPQLIFWFFQVYIMERHFIWFHGPFPRKDFIWVRGAIYLLMLVNAPISGGGLLIYIQRKTGIGWSKLIGMMLFRFGLMLWGIGFLMIPATLAMHRYGVFEKTPLNPYIWWGLLIFGVLWFIEAWFVWHYDRKFGLSKIVVRDKNTEFWTAFRMATPYQWWWTIVMGIPPLFLSLAGFWVFAIAFGVRVPFLQYIVLAPMLFLLADNPISLAGIGTTTMAWFIFFKDYGDPETVKSMTLLLPFARAVVNAVIGLICLKPAMDEIERIVDKPVIVSKGEA